VNVTITTKLVESIANVDENVESKLICYVEIPMNLVTIIETKSACNNGKTTQIFKMCEIPYSTKINK
jgi:hypothetical protein